MKIVIILILVSLHTFSFAQVSKDTIQSVEYYEFTEAYIIYSDTTLNLSKTYVVQSSGIILMPLRDSTIISITRGSIDSVQYLGHAIKIVNPSFVPTRDDSEFFKWSYMGHRDTQYEKAFIMKEYITGSLEKRGKKYYSFDIANYSEGYEYQFYGYLKITSNTNNKD